MGLKGPLFKKAVFRPYVIAKQIKTVECQKKEKNT